MSPFCIEYIEFYLSIYTRTYIQMKIISQEIIKRRRKVVESASLLVFEATMKPFSVRIKMKTKIET